MTPFTGDAAALWASLKLDGAGLITAVVQDVDTGQILMLAHMNQEALTATLTTRKATFWSRSRQSLWIKGETSGNTLHVEGVRVDCDRDAILVQAHPAGPACHTGRRSCFYNRIEGGDAANLPADEGQPPPAIVQMAQTFSVVLDRKAGRGATNRDGKSYVRSLLDKGAPKIGAKIREEADELAVAVAEESDERVISEAADLIFHAMVGLAHRDVSLDQVADALGKRMGLSGIDEKAARPGPSSDPDAPSDPPK